MVRISQPVWYVCVLAPFQIRWLCAQSTFDALALCVLAYFELTARWLTLVRFMSYAQGGRVAAVAAERVARVRHGRHQPGASCSLSLPLPSMRTFAVRCVRCVSALRGWIACGTGRPVRHITLSRASLSGFLPLRVCLVVCVSVQGSVSSAWAPFGGIKESGFGREGSHHGLEDYLQMK